jgi:hypothetical protein
LCDVLAEEGEGRIGDNNVSLFKELNTFSRAEISVAVELLDSDFLCVGKSVSVLVTLIDKGNAFAVGFVASGDKFFQSKFLEVEGEVFEEVAFPCVVAIAIYGFAVEVLSVMHHFFLDVGKLSVELIIPFFLSFM